MKTLDEQILDLIRRRPRKTQTLLDYFHMQTTPKVSSLEVEEALQRLVDGGGRAVPLRCVAGPRQVGRAGKGIPRLPRSKASEKTNALRVGLMTDSALIAQVRELHTYLSDDWGESVREALAGKKSTAEKCRRNLTRLAERKEEHGDEET
jgi:hypothetical protein